MQFTLLAAYCWHLRSAGARYSGVFKFDGDPVTASGKLSFGKQSVEFNNDKIVLHTVVPITTAQAMVGMPLSRVIELAPTNNETVDLAIASLRINDILEVDDKLSLQVGCAHEPMPLFEIKMPWA